MVGFSYLLNRRGHYYFRIAIPHALVPRFNARELIYSLKTKNLAEAKLRCRSMHQAALWLFRGIEEMPRITPEEAKKIAKLYFKECLDRLTVQVMTVDLYSDSLMKVLNQRPDIPSVAGEGATDDILRLDFLLPDNFEYKNKDNPAEVTGMTLGFRNAFDGDMGRVVDYLIGKHGIDAEKGSLSYKTLEKAVGRAIRELLRIHQAKADLEADIPIVDEWFTETAPKVVAIAPPEDETPLVSIAKNLFLEESRKAEEAERTLRRKDAAISFWIEVMGDMPMGSITKRGARTYKETLAKLYTGNFEWDGQLYQGTHKPIISSELWQIVQDVLDNRSGNRPKKRKHDFAFSGLIRCGYTGTYLVGEIKKGRYVYYRALGAKGVPYVKQEVLEDKFSQVLKGLHFDDDVLEWVIQALKESHADTRHFQEETVSRLQTEYKRLEGRLQAMYIDKLDEKITSAFYEEKAAEWRKEQKDILDRIRQVQDAGQSYMDEGVQLLERVVNQR